jgi:hypothetical protein
MTKIVKPKRKRESNNLIQIIYVLSKLLEEMFLTTGQFLKNTFQEVHVGNIRMCIGMSE